MIEFHEIATAEARGAQAWYAERSRAAAESFQTQLGKTVARIVAAPRQFAFLRKPYRSARVFGFPYVLVFRLKADGTPFITAVAHTSRRSGYWQGRE